MKKKYSKIWSALARVRRTQVTVFPHETIISRKTLPLVNYNLVATSDSLLVTRDTRMNDVANDKSTFMSPATTRLNIVSGLNHSQFKTVGPIPKRLQSDNKKNIPSFR